MKKKVLFIAGSMNMNTMAHAVARHLEASFDCYFTPYYCDGLLRKLAQMGLTEFSIIGEKHRERALQYFEEQNVQIDLDGRQNDYDLVVTTSDLIVQKNIRNSRTVLIQEGMTDPENLMYYLVRLLGLPRYLASTSTTGLSDAYDAFCVASYGYRDLFVAKGVRPEKIRVTGIPNFDDAKKYLKNNFPFRNYVLVATSDSRETLKIDSRKRFLRWALNIADGRPLIFKLHPNEKVERSSEAIRKYAPDAIIFDSGNTNEMVANCDVLITQYSSVSYVGLALGKEVHSYFDVDMLRKLTPIQNSGKSAQNIATLCREMIEGEMPDRLQRKNYVKPLAMMTRQNLNRKHQSFKYKQWKIF